MKKFVFMIMSVFLLLTACSDNTVSYSSAAGKPKPYILKQDCSFSIVKENSSASVASPTVSGMAGSSASASVSLGNIAIKVSDCMVVENSHALPVYED